MEGTQIICHACLDCIAIVIIYLYVLEYNLLVLIIQQLVDSCVLHELLQTERGDLYSEHFLPWY